MDSAADYRVKSVQDPQTGRMVGLTEINIFWMGHWYGSCFHGVLTGAQVEQETMAFVRRRNAERKT